MTTETVIEFPPAEIGVERQFGQKDVGDTIAGELADQADIRPLARTHGLVGARRMRSIMVGFPPIVVHGSSRACVGRVVRLVQSRGHWYVAVRVQS